MAGGRTGPPSLLPRPSGPGWRRARAPGGPYAGLATTALADLYSLTLRNGGVIASTAPAWHYVWPRDAAFAAAAFARTGHLADAVADLRFLQAVQAPDGSFQARYLVDGSGPPDDRGIQDDDPGGRSGASTRSRCGTGPPASRIATSLTTWCTARYAPARPHERAGSPAPTQQRLLGGRRDQLTLGIAAPTLVGLLAGSRLVQDTDPTQAALADRRATTLRASIQEDFGTSGYSRYPGGRGPDAAVTFTLPPYVDAPLSGAVAAAQNAVPKLLQPGGGVSPGATWPHRDQVSWTPESALFLLADAARATGPVRSTGCPGSPSTRAPGRSRRRCCRRAGRPTAPLAWTDALVLLSLAELDQIAPTGP